MSPGTFTEIVEEEKIVGSIIRSEYENNIKHRIYLLKSLYKNVGFGTFEGPRLPNPLTI